MSDPQHELKLWLRGQAKTRGLMRTAKALGGLLNLCSDSVRAMMNVEGLGHMRRIEAHHIPPIVAYFRAVPPGFEFMEAMSQAPSPELWYWGA